MFMNSLVILIYILKVLVGSVGIISFTVYTQDIAFSQCSGALLLFHALCSVLKDCMRLMKIRI